MDALLQAPGPGYVPAVPQPPALTVGRPSIRPVLLVAAMFLGATFGTVLTASQAHRPTARPQQSSRDKGVVHHVVLLTSSLEVSKR
jgi:hypothetical protein